MPAGEKSADGTYPADSINGRVVARLNQINERMREQGPQSGPDAWPQNRADAEAAGGLQV